MTGSILTREEIEAFEAIRREELFGIARTMTDLGLPGEDPDDPRIAALLARGFEATSTHDDLKAWIARHK